MIISLLEIFVFSSAFQLQTADESMEFVLCLLNPGFVLPAASLFHGIFFFDQARKKLDLRLTIVKYIKQSVFK